MGSFDDFLSRVLPPLGLAPRPHHRRQVRRRLSRRIAALGLRDWAAYAALVEGDTCERAVLASRLGVTISRFWRNRGLWEFLGERVVPGLCPRGFLRAWSCGCASGEEPYSLALLWRERCPGRPAECSWEILATDIDPVVLGRAGEGMYPAGSLRELPAALRGRYFRELPGGLFSLVEEARGGVSFRAHDLRRDPPPAEGPFDLILCRNLAFTYFGGEARREAACTLASKLAPGGGPALGRKECLPEGATELSEAGYPGLYRLLS